MDGSFPEDARVGGEGLKESPPPVSAVWPLEQTVPVVVSSPHSGRHYPAELTRLSRLDSLTLRLSEDSFTDELFAAAPARGMPLIAATHARAYVDCNREPFELDPTMFSDALPAYVRPDSAGVRTGFGTIARRVTPTHDIYAVPLNFAEAKARIERVYRPYYRALRAALERTRAAFGHAFLIDVHSMPGPAMPEAAGIDIVLGDRGGRSADPRFVDAVQGFLESRGYRVARNTPYAEGFITAHYGDPAAGCDALQIEIDRRLYMDQATITKTPGFARLQSDMTALLDHIARWSRRRTAAQERKKKPLR